MIARSLAAAPVPSATSTWPIPAVLVAAIGIVGVRVYKNGDRIDAVQERIITVETRLSETPVDI